MTPGSPRSSIAISCESSTEIADGDFDPLLFEHSAVYNRLQDRIEMYLVARQPHRVQLTGLDWISISSKDEAIRTEISCKYDRSRVQSMLAASGFELDRWFTDPDQLFALALAQKK